jgi:hypothetical protein
MQRFDIVIGINATSDTTNAVQAAVQAVYPDAAVTASATNEWIGHRFTVAYIPSDAIDHDAEMRRYYTIRRNVNRAIRATVA